MHMIRSLALTVGFALCAIPSPGGVPALTTDDVVAIKAANQACVSAWLSDNLEAVMSTLTEDPFLIPHHGDEPAIGAAPFGNSGFPRTVRR